MSAPKLIALVGPTASGKSDLALELAEQTKGVILSCDSLLVYKDLQIGTAKPTKEEMQRVPHFGIDLVDVDKKFNAGDYVRYAQGVIEDHIKKNTPVIIVGGTGFYLKALLCGVWDAPPTQPEFREKLETEIESWPKEERMQRLYNMLLEKDAAYAEKVKPQDKYRVIRALEIIDVTKQKLSETLKTQEMQNALPYNVPVLGIKRTKLEQERRIIERTNQMFSKGLVQETKDLVGRFTANHRPFSCVGYHEVLQHLDGKMTLPECRERVIISTRQLAKKQMTFFNTFPKEIQWFLLPSQKEEISRCALEHFRVGSS